MNLSPLKNKSLSSFFLLLLIPILLPKSAFPSHGQMDNEKKLGQLLEKNIVLGEPVWLDDGQHKFFAIYTPDQSAQPKGAVILLHDASAHPDHINVIYQIRRSLPVHGWATLSIQLPRIDRLENFVDHQPLINKRINSSVVYLTSIGIANLTLTGHGTGAMSAVNYLASEENSIIRGFIGISLGVLANADIPAQIEKIRVPMLDIYGSRDLPYVIRSAESRSLAAKKSGSNAYRLQTLKPYKQSAIAKTAGNKMHGYITYRQIRLEGADHNFTGHELNLSKRILGWLERHTKGVAIVSE